MRIITTSKLVKFWVEYPTSEQQLKAWVSVVKKANWKTPDDIKRQFRSASFVKNNRVIFNIKGNDYRLITAIAYNYGAVYIKFIGTHAEYDKINASEV